MFMLVETRGPFDEGGRSSRRAVAGHAARLGPAMAGADRLALRRQPHHRRLGRRGCVYLAVGLAAWRGLRALPTEGLNQQKQ